MRGAELTDLEYAAIAATLHAGEDAYGVRIAEEIAERTGREVSIGSLYRTLRRLETRGFLSSEVGEATAERGGRAKRYYQVEAPGLNALRRATRDIRSLLEGLEVRWEHG